MNLGFVRPRPPNTLMTKAPGSQITTKTRATKVTISDNQNIRRRISLVVVKCSGSRWSADYDRLAGCRVPSVPARATGIGVDHETNVDDRVCALDLSARAKLV